MANAQTLACFVDQDHLLWVGNPSANPIPQGTELSLSAMRLETNGNCANPLAYCATVPAPEPIPQHLFIRVLGYQPIFDDQAPCQAWREVPPVLTQ
jgi:hypothetical protein